MKTPRTRIAKTVAQKTLKEGSSKEYARELAAYLLAERRAGDIDSLLRDVQAAWAEQGYVEVIARVSHSLSQGARDDIERRIRQLYPAAQRIVVTEVHDPAVIGGVQIRLADQQLDLSVDAKLRTFKQLTQA